MKFTEILFYICINLVKKFEQKKGGVLVIDNHGY